jgi:hypothetical protein
MYDGTLGRFLERARKGDAARFRLLFAYGCFDMAG